MVIAGVAEKIGNGATLENILPSASSVRTNRTVNDPFEAAAWPKTKRARVLVTSPARTWKERGIPFGVIIGTSARFFP